MLFSTFFDQIKEIGPGTIARQRCFELSNAAGDALSTIQWPSTLGPNSMGPDRAVTNLWPSTQVGLVFAYVQTTKTAEKG